MELTGSYERQYLEKYFEKEGSQIVILYGQKHMGTGGLLRAFCLEKEWSFYQARPCSFREQVYLWGRERREEGAFVSEYPSCTDILYSMIEKRTRKKVIVIHEFQHLVKQSETFMGELIEFVHNQWNNQPVMIVLSSTSIGWVENSMVKKIGETVYEISGLIKMKEQSFFDMARFFPETDRREQIEIYGVLGGFCGLWKHFEKGVSLRENICRHILDMRAFLHEEALRLAGEELRETNVYHAILSALAEGRQKLNELHLHTGFSRAKISVYLKNLMELEIVEKVFSYDTAGREHTQKGIYRIKNRLVYFYFRFVYAHLSRLDSMLPEDFYDTYIGPALGGFVSSCFEEVCREYMERENEQGHLPFVWEKSGEWVGKAGNIHIVAQDEQGNTLVGFCNWEKPVMPYEDYEWMLFCASKAKLKPDYIYLFSATGFDETLMGEARGNEKIKLLDLHAF